MANNHSQQSSTIASIVKQACEDEGAYQELSLQIIMFAKANAQNKEAAKPIVDTVKQIIKDRKVDSPSKVYALKLLHRCAMEGGSDEFMLYMEKKIMSRLAILARHKKESSDLEKGAQLFGKGANQKASADFLKLLLLNIQQWAARFPMQSGKPSEIAKIYQSLVKEKVHFPTEEQVMSSLSQDYYAGSETQNQSGYNPSSTAPQSLNHSAFISHNPSSSNAAANLAPTTLNRAQFLTQTPAREAANMSILDQSARKSLNASTIMNQSAAAVNSSDIKLTREEQMQIASQIKSDYKKLGEYQNTAKLAQEVMSMGGGTSGGQIDEDLVVQFRDQLSEGKEFAEKFLKVIIETPFNIKDRDSKVEKILGIISDIDQQLHILNGMKPPPKKKQIEETKIATGGAMTPSQRKLRKSTTTVSQTAQPPQESDRQSFPELKVDPSGSPKVGAASKKNGNNNGEIKGILKTSKQQQQQIQQFNTQNNNIFNNEPPFQSARQPADKDTIMQSAFSDFKVDQSAFKTNFANMNATQQTNVGAGFDSIFQSQAWGSGFVGQSQQFDAGAPHGSFMDFMAFNNQNNPNQKAVSQSVDQFDFGAAFANHQSMPQPSGGVPFEDFKFANEALDATGSKSNKNVNQQLEVNRQSSLNAKKQAPSAKQSSQSIQSIPGDKPQLMKGPSNNTNIQPNATASAVMDRLMLSKRSSMMSRRSSGRSNVGEDQFNVIKNVQSHQPQITARTPDSNPASDMEDGGQLSSSGEKAQFNIPSTINQSQILRQSFANRDDSIHFPKDSINSGQNDNQFAWNDTPSSMLFNKSQGKHTPTAGLQENSSKNKKQPAFEKFDFSEIQVTQRSSNQGSGRQPDLNRTQTLQFGLDENSNKQLQQALIDKKALELQVKQLQENNDKFNQELKKMQHIEFQYEEEKYSKVQLEEEIRVLAHKADEYKKMAERMEHKVNKGQKEHDLAIHRAEELEQQLSSLEKDMDVLRSSESETKRQLTSELLESRHREEDLKTQLQLEISEGKKREAFMREQWYKDLQDKEKGEEEWEQKVKLMNEQLSERDKDLAKLKKEKEELTKELQTKNDHIQNLEQELQGVRNELQATKDQMQNHQKQQLMIKGKQIKFSQGLNASKGSGSSTQVTPVAQVVTTYNPTTLQVKEVALVQSQPPHNANDFDFAFNQPEPSQVENITKPDDASLFPSVIKPKEEEVKRELSPTPKNTNYEETMGYIPSGDSDNNAESPKSQRGEELKKSPITAKKIPNSQIDLVELKNEPFEEVPTLSNQNPFMPSELQTPAVKEEKPMLESKQVDPFDFAFPTTQDKPQQQTSAPMFQEQQKVDDSDKPKEQNPPIHSVVKPKKGSFDFSALNNDDQEEQDQEIIGFDAFAKSNEYRKSTEEHQFGESEKKCDEIHPQIEQNNVEHQDKISPLQSPDISSPVAQSTIEHNIQQEPLKNVEPNVDPFDLFENVNPPKPQLEVQKIDDKILPKEEVKAQPPMIEVTQTRKSLPEPPCSFNIDELLAGIISAPITSNHGLQSNVDPAKERKDSHISSNSSDHNKPLEQPSLLQVTSTPLVQSPDKQPPIVEPQQQAIIQQITTPLKLQQPAQLTPIQQMPQPSPVLRQPDSQPPTPQNVTFDKSQFSTANTVTFQQQQQKEMQSQHQLNPQALMQSMLIQFFRKSLMANKAVLFEDPNVQIGVVADYQPNLVRMRLFFGNKQQPAVEQISFTQVMRPYGFQSQQSRDHIPLITQGDQQPIDINMQIENYQLSIPVYGLSYKMPNMPSPTQTIPVRLPLILLKLCNAVPNLDTPIQYINKWQQMSSQSESKQHFNIDFSQCRSLTQLKETLKLGRNSFNFVDGVEQQKNIVCGATSFQKRTGGTIIALIKVMLTVDGHNCEIQGRSNDEESGDTAPESHGKFAKFIIGNVLELIALPRMAQAPPQTPSKPYV